VWKSTAVICTRSGTPRQAALLSLSGLLVASTLEAKDQEAVETVVAALDGLAALTSDRLIERTAAGREVTLRLLEASGERPVGVVGDGRLARVSHRPPESRQR
jgi:hypothetical protein